MTIKEKIAYLEGLAEGMAVDATENGKLFAAIIDIFSDIADEIDELNENALDIGDELDAISDDLAEVEDFLLEDDYDMDDEDFDFDFDEDDYEDEDDVNLCDLCGKGNATFKIDVKCPECNAEIELDDEAIANESVNCPVCSKEIELEIDEVDVGGDDDTGDNDTGNEE